MTIVEGSTKPRKKSFPPVEGVLAAHHHFTISTFHHYTVLTFHHFTMCCVITSPFHCSTIIIIHYFTITPLHCSSMKSHHYFTVSLLHHCTLKPLQHCMIALIVGWTLPKIKHIQDQKFHDYSSEFECFGQCYWKSAYLHESCYQNQGNISALFRHRTISAFYPFTAMKVGRH